VDRPAAVAQVLEQASARGIGIEDISLRRPNLESVFLHLTGRELRD
jgi:ABC-2 type transport system ATP-binding protein